MNGRMEARERTTTWKDERARGGDERKKKERVRMRNKSYLLCCRRASRR
jgi:hypothetical protein